MRKFLTPILLFTLISAFGQEDEDRKKSPIFGVRAGVLDHFHPEFPAWDVGLELFAFDRVSVIVSSGFFYAPPGVEWELVDGRGLTFEGRYYIPVDKGFLFLGLRNYTRRLTIYDRYTLGHLCTSDLNDCVYYSDYTGNIKTTLEALQGVIGFKLFLVPDFFAVDYSLGLGRKTSYVNRNLLNGGYFVEENRLFSEDDFVTREHITIKATLILQF